MKIQIDVNECGTIYFITPNYGREFEVSRDFKEVYDNVMKDFNTIQKILSDMYEGT